MELLTTNDFAEIIFTKDSNKLTVVKFTAYWCSSCMGVLSTIEQLEKEYPDVLFFKVEVDQSSELADKYEVDRLPTFLFFRNRVVVNFKIGNEPIDKFKRIIEKERK